MKKEYYPLTCFLVSTICVLLNLFVHESTAQNWYWSAILFILPYTGLWFILGMWKKEANSSPLVKAVVMFTAVLPIVLASTGIYVMAVRYGESISPFLVTMLIVELTVSLRGLFLKQIWVQ